MNTITVRLNSEEQQAFNEYAKLYGIPLSTLFKKTLEEKIEDELDLKAIKNYEADIKNNTITTYGHEEVRKLLGL